jgi:hypothetical protein
MPLLVGHPHRVDEVLSTLVKHPELSDRVRAWANSAKGQLVASGAVDELARALLLLTGSPARAQRAIARNKDILEKPKRDVDDRVLLDIAAAIQRRDKCSDNAAITKVVLQAGYDADKSPTVVRRLRYALRRKTLKQFSGSRPKWLCPAL